jgi:hypothetical protein
LAAAAMATMTSGKRKLLGSEPDQPQPQILRVRRRRSDAGSAAVNVLRIATAAAPAPIQPQPLDALLANWTVTSGDENPTTQQTPLLYERVEATTTKKRRKDDIVDAHFLEEEEDDEDSDDDADNLNDRAASRPDSTRSIRTAKNKKRRKLQIINDGGGPAATSRRGIVGTAVAAYPTLTPAQSRVDESLLLVFQGERTLVEHLSFLQNAFADHEGDNGWMVWLNWCSRPSGTILHAAALWDQAAPLQALLQQQMGDNDHVLSSERLLYTLDEEGHSALDIARLSCHESMIVFLERLENQSEVVYDFYELRPPGSGSNTTTAAISNNAADSGPDHHHPWEILDCELLRHNAAYHAGGVDADLDLLEYTGNNNDAGDDDDEQDGDDDDSNNEDFFTNDYPDEEDSSADGNNFRDYDDDGDDGDFDPAYGGIYGQRQQDEDYE